eukprot:SAG22_NODE_7_length_40155_cov_25.241356_13_plen_223_part_00
MIEQQLAWLKQQVGSKAMSSLVLPLEIYLRQCLAVRSVFPARQDELKRRRGSIEFVPSSLEAGIQSSVKRSKWDTNGGGGGGSAGAPPAMETGAVEAARAAAQAAAAKFSVSVGAAAAAPPAAAGGANGLPAKPAAAVAASTGNAFADLMAHKAAMATVAHKAAMATGSNGGGPPRQPGGGDGGRVPAQSADGGSAAAAVSDAEAELKRKMLVHKQQAGGRR